MLHTLKIFIRTSVHLSLFFVCACACVCAYFDLFTMSLDWIVSRALLAFLTISFPSSTIRWRNVWSLVSSWASAGRANDTKVTQSGKKEKKKTLGQEAFRASITQHVSYLCMPQEPASARQLQGTVSSWLWFSEEERHKQSRSISFKLQQDCEPKWMFRF